MRSGLDDRALDIPSSPFHIALGLRLIHYFGGSVVAEQWAGADQAGLLRADGSGGVGADGEHGHGGHADRRRRSRQGSDDALSEH